jgi:crotonobetainyl-CoA:carnitine CoA-transferase CaiB-like acyl-CoA transferase
MMLGDLGAEVLKIEPCTGDSSRGFAGPDHEGEVFYYLAFNKNKKSVVLDLAVESNKQAFYDLVKVSDVVWDNFRPGITARLGVDFETLRTINPRIVCCSITGYGLTGPHSHQLSYDIVAQAQTGIMSITGEPGRPPVRCGPPIGDIAGAMNGVIGVLAALTRRGKDGKGEKVDVSLLDSSAALMAYYYSYYFCSGVMPGPQGSGHIGVSPYGAFRTKDDRWIATGINWPRIARVIGAEWLIDDPRFQTQKGRVENKQALEQIMQEQFLQADAEQWLALFDAEDMPGGLVQNIEEAVQDEQILNNGMIHKFDHRGGQIRLVGNPIKMHDIRDEEYTPPPLLGQHTREVLASVLNYSSADIDRLIVDCNDHAEELSKHLHKEK